MVGTQKMRTMYFTCDFVSAQEMYRLGAVEQVVPAEELMPAALELAGRIAAKSPIGLRMAKASLNRMEASLSDWDRAYRIEQDYSGKMRDVEDSREARAAWNEKRPPVWSWR
jgi:enoyl-CoA hydratase